MGGVLVCSCCYNRISWTGETYKWQTFISHSSEPEVLEEKAERERERERERAEKDRITRAVNAVLMNLKLMQKAVRSCSRIPWEKFGCLWVTLRRWNLNPSMPTYLEDSPFLKFQFNLVLKNKQGTSLVVQWLRLHAPNAGGLVRSLVRELDPACLNWRSHMPQLRPGAAK